MPPTRILAASNSFSRLGQWTEQTDRQRQTASPQLTALIINKLQPNGNYSAPGVSVSSVGGPPSA